MVHIKYPRVVVVVLASTFVLGAAVIFAGCGGGTPADNTGAASTGVQPPPSPPTASLPSQDVGVAANGICGDAYAQVQQLPVPQSLDDFAKTQTEVNRIVRTAASELESAGASELASAFEAYAAEGESLALAYEQGSTEGVSEAMARFEATGTKAERVADQLGADQCMLLAGV